MSKDGEKQRVLSAGTDEDEREEAADEGTDYNPHVAECDAFLVKISKNDMTALEAGQADAESDDTNAWTGANVLATPFSPRGLLWLYRNSSVLRQNVEAIAQNVDGFGWFPESVFAFDAEDIVDQIANSVYLEQMILYEVGERKDPPKLPSDKEVAKIKETWKREAAIEKLRLTTHFDNACFESSFIQLRKKKTTDRESIGWGTWEIIRWGGRHGKPGRYKHIPAHTLRLQRLGNPVEVDELQRISPIAFRTVKVWRRFRIIVQQDEEYGGTAKLYFRELGDPRIISSKTGKIYKTEDELHTEEDAEDCVAQVANEILMFALYMPASAYGAPRYHGVIPEIKGAWLAAHHTVDYLENSAVPRGLLLVNDGRLNKRSVRDIKGYFGTIKGRAENRIAVIQAETPRDRALEASGRVKMEWVSLAEAQREDATFSEYDKRVGAKVSEAFRLPPLMLGNTESFNRATAQAAMRFAEEQVFAPERAEFDWIINNQILPLLGIRFWRFRSRGPVRLEAEVVAKVLEVLLKNAVMVPAEARSIAERLLGIDLMRSAGDWQQLPLPLLLQGYRVPPDQRPGKPEDAGDIATADEGDLKDLGKSAGDRAAGLARANAELRELLGDEGLVDQLVSQLTDSTERDRATVAKLEKVDPGDGAE